MIDKVVSVTQIKDDAIRLDFASPTTICVSGFLTRGGSHFSGNFLRIENHWCSFEDVWNDGMYHEVWTPKLKSVAIEFMVRNLENKMYRIETSTGRCAVFGAKTSLFGEDGKIMRMGKVLSGTKLLCQTFRG